MTGAGGPAGPGEADWLAARATLLYEMARDELFAPHWKLVAQHAFDRVRDAILAEAPLTPPCPYLRVRHEHGGTPPFGERADAAAGPVERTLLLLFAAAAMRHMEPVLDRGRVFSALPARSGEGLLLASSDWWSDCYRRATQEAVDDPRWSHMVQVDVAHANEGIDRRALLAGLAAAGLPPAWSRIGRRLDRALAPTVGAAGFLYDLMASGALATLALRPLDTPAAGPERPSFRLIDSILLPAGDAADAERVADEIRTRLRRMGLSANPRKSRVTTRTAFAEERHRTRRYRAEADGVDAARRVIADLAAFGSHAARAEEWALVTLARAGDPVALDHAIAGFAAEPWAARIRALYLREFVADPAVLGRFAGELAAAAERLHSWQWMWALAVLWAAPALPPPLARMVATIARSGRFPDPVRAAAAIVWARFATAAGWQALEQAAGDARSAHLRAAIAFGFRYRSAAARRTTLADWARRDPEVALVAGAIDREADGTTRPDQPPGASDGA
ncbi:hypothetical protein [Stella sp.]|uniref:hypothetical protein n=1 Tax=Stella sp. TaxID=2912054 RepID=UPI0035AE1CAB